MAAESCPRCGLKNLWYDLHGWGCNNCGYAVIGGQSTSALLKDLLSAKIFDENLSAKHQAELRRNKECAF